MKERLIILFTIIFIGTTSCSLYSFDSKEDNNISGQNQEQIVIETEENSQFVVTEEPSEEVVLPSANIVIQTYPDNIVSLIELPSLERTVIYTQNDILTNAVQLFPDGEHIAFLSDQDNEGNFITDIFLGDIHGTEPINLTKNNLPNTSLDISPDNNEIAYISESNDVEVKHDLFKVNLSGEITQLTADGLQKYQPRWSPNGLWIAYIVEDGETKSLVIVSSDGAEKIFLHNDDFLSWSGLSWSPDSKTLVVPVKNNGEVLILAVDSETLDKQFITNEGLCIFPEFFSNKTQIIFQCIDQGLIIIKQYDFKNEETIEIINFGTDTEAVDITAIPIPDSDFFLLTYCTGNICDLYALSNKGEKFQIISGEDIGWFGFGSVRN